MSYDTSNPPHSLHDQPHLPTILCHFIVFFSSYSSHNHILEAGKIPHLSSLHSFPLIPPKDQTLFSQLSSLKFEISKEPSKTFLLHLILESSRHLLSVLEWNTSFLRHSSTEITQGELIPLYFHAFLSFKGGNTSQNTKNTTKFF